VNLLRALERVADCVRFLERYRDGALQAVDEAERGGDAGITDAFDDLHITVVDRAEDGLDREAEVLEHRLQVLLHHLGRDVRRVYLLAGQDGLPLLVASIRLLDGVEEHAHVLDLRTIRPQVQ